MDSSTEQATENEKVETIPASSLPAYPSRHPIARAFDAFASAVTRWAGSPMAFGIAVVVIVGWLVTGPIFGFSDAWQLIINTGTTVVTFLMVFLIQQSQNKDSVAIHLKLNELMAATRGANNQLIGIECVSEEDLRRIAEAYLALADKANATLGERSKVKREVDQAKAESGRESTRHTE